MPVVVCGAVEEPFDPGAVYPLQQLGQARSSQRPAYHRRVTTDAIRSAYDALGRGDIGPLVALMDTRWAQLLLLRGGKIVDMEDFAHPGRALRAAAS